MARSLHYSLLAAKSTTNCSSHFHLLHPIDSHPFSSNSASGYFVHLSDLLKGRIHHSQLLQIQAQIFRVGAHQDNLVATRLIGQYPSQFALRVFHQLREPNIFPFNAIIRVLSEEGLCSEAFLIFRGLKLISLSPNDLTFSFILKACSRSKNEIYAKQAHTHVVKSGIIHNPVVCNGLLVVYEKGLKDLASARKVFDEMTDRTSVCSWTSLIAGFSHSGQAEEALHILLSMLKQNLNPEDDTMVSVLSACSNLNTTQIEKWVSILSQFSANFDSRTSSHDSINTILVYLYGKSKKIDESREQFDEISENGRKSIITWNTIIGAYVQNGSNMDALRLFRLLMSKNYCKPNHITMVFVLSACSHVGDLELGIWVHQYMKSNGRKGVLASNTNLATSLIDMYSKCGCLAMARHVFDEIMTKDVVSFNTMIMGLAINGRGQEAFVLFSKFKRLGLNPDSQTLLALLCACSHSGLLEKGREIFKKFSCKLGLKHYACYIDLLARMGFIEEGLEVVRFMPFEPNGFVWGALLGGCLIHNKLDLAKGMSNLLVEVDPENSGGYVVLSNALAVEHQWGDVMGIRSFMRERRVKKQTGCSWITVDGVVHEFVVGLSQHCQDHGVLGVLDCLVKEMKLPSF